MSVQRWLADIRGLGRVVELRWASVAIPRYRCVTRNCGRVVFNQDLGKLAAPRSATTRRRARYVLRRLKIDRTTVSAIAVELGVSWLSAQTADFAQTVQVIAMDGFAGYKTAADQVMS